MLIFAGVLICTLAAGTLSALIVLRRIAPLERRVAALWRWDTADNTNIRITRHPGTAVPCVTVPAHSPFEEDTDGDNSA